MAKYCEACSALASEGAVPSNARRVRNLLVGDRIVYLCDFHADLVVRKDLSSIAALRSALHEPQGKRSLVDRRGPLDRRAFARPEGRRHVAGRRASDGSG